MLKTDKIKFVFNSTNKIYMINGSQNLTFYFSALSKMSSFYYTLLSLVFGLRRGLRCHPRWSPLHHFVLGSPEQRHWTRLARDRVAQPSFVASNSCYQWWQLVPPHQSAFYYSFHHPSLKSIDRHPLQVHLLPNLSHFWLPLLVLPMQLQHLPRAVLQRAPPPRHSKAHQQSHHHFSTAATLPNHLRFHRRQQLQHHRPTIKTLHSPATATSSLTSILTFKMVKTQLLDVGLPHRPQRHRRSFVWSSCLSQQPGSISTLSPQSSRFAVLVPSLAFEERRLP